MIPIDLLRSNAVNEEIRGVLSNIVLPPEMTVESFMAQLLDSYQIAQVKYNTDKPAGNKLNFVQIQAPTNPMIGVLPNQYKITKSYTIRAVVDTVFTGVTPALV